MIKTIPKDYWTKPPYERHQLVLFGPSLDDAVSKDHAVRELDVILEDLAWTEFEQDYDGIRGQPPIHPRYVSAAILYGIICGVTTSRRLEEATRVRIDFMWLLQGQTIDHATLAKFRTRFEMPLKALFRQINRKALRRMESRLTELIFDGTRIRANSDRSGARTAEWLERKLEELQHHMEEALTQMGTADLREDMETAAPEALQHHLEGLRREMERCEKALAVARERDKAKQERDGRKATPVRVPVTDTDSCLLPNKEGGFAPNYTPVVAVAPISGLIVATEVLPDGAEAATVQPLLQTVQQDYKARPQRVLFDSNFANGANQEALAQKGIDVYAPTDSPTGPAHPAHREDPSQPLPPERIATLPRVKSTGKLDRNAFLYDPPQDVYWCPMGRALPKTRQQTRQNPEGPVTIIEYQCRNCEHCPLAAGCLSKKARRRRINRDQFEAAREQTNRRMATAESKTVYGRRAPVIEGTFGCLKGVMGIRRFLLRGLEKVRIEWLWICTAFNLKKWLRFLATGGPRRPNLPVPPEPCRNHPRCGLLAVRFFGGYHFTEFFRGARRFVERWFGAELCRAA